MTYQTEKMKDEENKWKKRWKVLRNKDYLRLAKKLLEQEKKARWNLHISDILG